MIADVREGSTAHSCLRRSVKPGNVVFSPDCEIRRCVIGSVVQESYVPEQHFETSLHKDDHRFY